MQDHVDTQVKRMDAVVDRIEAGWRGPAATAWAARVVLKRDTSGPHGFAVHATFPVYL